MSSSSCSYYIFRPRPPHAKHVGPVLMLDMRPFPPHDKHVGPVLMLDMRLFPPHAKHVGSVHLMLDMWTLYLC